jgi:uncharacterized RDD family membrane protein YckC
METGMELENDHPLAEAAPPRPAGHAGEIAGFWRRFAAFFLDGLVMGVLGALLAFTMYDKLVDLGGSGRLIGFVIAFVYFGLCNSRLSNGQTPGEKLMKVRVVSRDGAPLSVARSFLRAFVFSGPYFLNGAAIGSEALHNVALMTAVSFLVFGVALSDAYLFTFNRRTRQTIHDFVAGSFVVRAGRELAPPPGKAVWRGHFVVVGLLFVLSLGAPLIGERFFAQTELFPQLRAVQEALSHEPGVVYAGVTAGANTFASSQAGGKTTTNVVARLVVNPVPADKQAFADNAVKIILAAYPEADRKDVIVVTLVHGFDIGIASAWRAEPFAHSPADWRKRWAPKVEEKPARVAEPAAPANQN